MAEWTKSKFPGLRYREHGSRETGVGRSKRPLRYYVMAYKWKGKSFSEALGWEGDFVKNEDEAYSLFLELKQNRKDKTPPFTLKERNQLKDEALEQKEVEQEKKLIEQTTFEEIFRSYLVYSKANKRSEKSWQREQQLYDNHIVKVIGKVQLVKVSQIHLERIKKNMKCKGLADRTVRYALDVIRQVFNFGIQRGSYSGVNPAAKGKVKRPQEDNRKDRYLTRDEADALLVELLKRSKDTHEISLLSLFTGMRFGEVANLKWGNVDFFQEQIMLKKTKTATNRAAYMTPDIKAMLLARIKKMLLDCCNGSSEELAHIDKMLLDCHKGSSEDLVSMKKMLLACCKGSPEDLVFPARGTDNVQRKRISRVYYEVVNLLFNKDIIEKKERVDFHTLRHTFASWLMEDGTNIYYVKDLLGHSTVKTTERYAHVGDNEKRDAVLRLQRNN